MAVAARHRRTPEDSLPTGGPGGWTGVAGPDGMGRWVYVEDLPTATEVADLLRFSMRQVVCTYARRYNSFPRPTVVKSNGHTELWAREDVEEWDRHRRRCQAGEEGAA